MDDLYINDRMTIPASQLDIQQVRSSGPGGQNVNKVATKIVLSWKIDSDLIGSKIVESRLKALAGRRLNKENQIQIVSQESRSAERNATVAADRLRELILQAFVKPKPRVATKPSKGSIKRRLETKSKQSDKKTGRQIRSWD
jgi:ribosome-associated protein